jgi:hypothetical protein
LYTAVCIERLGSFDQTNESGLSRIIQVRSTPQSFCQLTHQNLNQFHVAGNELRRVHGD